MILDEIPELMDARKAANVGSLFFDNSARLDELPAVRYRDEVTQEWVTLDWTEYAKMVRWLALALLEKGAEPGETIAIISNSRLEWALADLAIISIGCITIPVYQSNMPDEVAYILKHAGVRVAFLEDREQLAKVLEVTGELPQLEKCILFEGKFREGDAFLELFSRLVSRGREIEEETGTEALDKRLATVSKDDVATVCYTSGTTGLPKGAVLTHRGILAEISAVVETMQIDPSHETLLFLPLAHIFARTGLLLHIASGNIISFAGSMETILKDLVEVRPTFVFSVPRIYEKIHTKIISGVATGSLLKKQIFGFSAFFGRRASKYRQRGKRVPPWISVFYRMGEMLVFNKVKRLFGGKLHFCISGGAPLSRDLAEFFHSAGVLVLEGYGLTENVAGACMNTPREFKFGSVGKPLPGVDVEIAEDGEILLKGDIVLREYFKNPEATAESLEDGWFHTGDIGEFDEAGYLKITDRKKDLIVTSAGKNIAPQYIENMLKGDRFISLAVVIGDQRKYLTALVTLDEDEVKGFADDREIEYEEFEEIAQLPEVRNLVDRAIKTVNSRLASFQTIKKFAIISKEFEIGEELTPTLKVKRKFTMEKYHDVIDSLYGDEQGGAPDA